jgi:hypothetical protein
MWSLDQVFARTLTSTGHAASRYTTKPGASGQVPARHLRSALLWALLLAQVIILPAAGISHGLSALHRNAVSLAGGAHAPTCGAACADDETSDSTVVAQDPGAPACERFCARIQQVYHDARTQGLLILLAQTPTGQGVLEYLLAMGAHFGDAFITWRDLRADGNVGETDMGGFIQLDSSRHTERILIRIYLAGILVHEVVESYFDIGDGLREMDTRHMDYVAQWYNGKFERELHALPFYHTLDPFYMPTEGNAYGFTYDAWLNRTNDGQLYLGERERSDLRRSDRLGRAWPPSDWLAEGGGLWFLGQGTAVTPVPNPLGLTTAMLAAGDLSVMVS